MGAQILAFTMMASPVCVAVGMLLIAHMDARDLKHLKRIEKMRRAQDLINRSNQAAVDGHRKYSRVLRERADRLVKEIQVEMQDAGVFARIAREGARQRQVS
jgi:hypothetical protein